MSLHEPLPSFRLRHPSKGKEGPSSSETKDLDDHGYIRLVAEVTGGDRTRPSSVLSWCNVSGYVKITEPELFIKVFHSFCGSINSRRRVEGRGLHQKFTLYRLYSRQSTTYKISFKIIRGFQVSRIIILITPVNGNPFPSL